MRPAESSSLTITRSLQTAWHALIGDVADLVGQVNDGLRLVEEAPPPATRHRGRRHHDARHEWYRCACASSRLKDVRRASSFSPSILKPAWRRKPCVLEHPGHLLKQSAGNELFDAIQAVVSGRMLYLTPLITGDVLRNLTAPADLADHELTPRQRGAASAGRKASA